MLGRLFAALAGRKPATSNAPTLTFEAFGPEEVALLEERREFVASVVAGSADRAPGWQPTLGNVQAIYLDGLEQGIADGAYFEAIGVLFGDELVRRYGLEWVLVHGEYGVTAAVALKGKQVFAAPIDMILKRIERAERVDFARLVEDTHRTLVEAAAGEVRDR